MIISADTRISALLKGAPEALETIAMLNTNFEKLRNPLLRRFLAPRVTIAEAAKIGGVELPVLFEELAKIGCIIKEYQPTHESFKSDVVDNTATLPTPTLTLNANAFLYRGEDPLREIQKALLELQSGETLLITADFKPSPLVRLMRDNGHSVLLAEYKNEWHTYITRENKTDFKAIERRGGDFQQMLELFKDRIIELDVRALSMPEPMLRILEYAEDLDKYKALFIHLRRVPEYLLPELQTRGFGWSFQQENGKVLMLIWRKWQCKQK